MKTSLYSSVRVAVVALALGALAFPALANDSKTIRALLSGYDEVPPVSTQGNGEFIGRLDGGGTSISYTLTYRNLRGATTGAAHIHFGTPGVNGGVVAHLCGGDAPPCTPVSGSISGTITAANVTGPAAQGIDPGQFDELLAAIAAGATYVNVHTDLHPGGEIRGAVK